MNEGVAIHRIILNNNNIPINYEIIDAVKTSRQTYQRMLTWVLNKITKVVEVVALVTVGFFWLHNLVISLLS